MFRPCLPPARSRWLVARLARLVWTLPTNLAGHLVGLLLTRSLPKRIGGPAASASLYQLHSHSRARALGAMAIGNVILAEETFIAGARGRWVLAHELSHTRQHTWLGPLYLPVHALLQVVSALASFVRPLRGFPPQHAYNPLERVLLYVPFDVLVDSTSIEDRQRELIFQAFGVP